MWSCTWVKLTLILGDPLPDNSAWAVGILAEVARQLGIMVEHPNQSQPNPSARPDETPRISEILSITAVNASY